MMCYWRVLIVIVFVVSSIPRLVSRNVTEADTSAAKKITDSIRTSVSNQVVVTGTRNEVKLKDSPVRIELVGKGKIQSTAMVNAGDLLKEQTGLLLQGGIRAGVQMNGLGPDYTLILIDGQPVIGRIAGVIDLSRLSVGNIERVEIVKGPMSSMYGSEALAGVVNIITQKPTAGWRNSIVVQGTTTGPIDTRWNSSFSEGNVSVSGFLDYKYSPPYTLSKDTLNLPYASFQDGTLHLNALWRTSEEWKIKGSFRTFGSRSEGSFIESVFGQLAKNSGSVEQWDMSGTVGTEWTHGRAHLNVTAYGSSYTERYNFDVNQGNAGNIDDLLRRIARVYAQYDLLFADVNRLTIGGEFLYDDISGTRYTDTSNPDQKPFYRTGVAFAQWEGFPTDWISYVLSARFDGNNVYGEALSPRLAILWKAAEHLRFSGSIGTGFKAPDFRQLYVVFSNRLPGAGYDLIGAARLGNQLDAERSVSFDLGLRYEDGQRELSDKSAVLYNADIRLFRNNLYNLIEYYLYGTVDGRNVYSYRNLSRAYTQGFEASIDLVYVNEDFGRFTFSAGYQFLDAVDVEVLEAIDNGMAGTIDDPLTREEYGGLWNRSENSGNIRLQFDTDDREWSANVRFQFVGRYGDESLDKNGIVISNPSRKVLDRDDEYVAGYVVMNVGLSKQFMFNSNTKLLLSIGANNLLDVFNPLLVPSLVGRQFFAQTSFSF